MTTPAPASEKWLYSFCVWPDELRGFRKSTFKLFDFLNHRIDMDFTEQEFEFFRSELSHDGLSLREIERTPYHEPELVL